MRKLSCLLFAFTGILFTLESNAQCPAFPPGTVGIYPDLDSLACIPNDSSQYSEYISVISPDSSSGIIYLILDSIVGLPDGISWSLDVPFGNPPNRLNAGDSGCLNIFGATKDTTGIYVTEIFVTVLTNIVPFPISSELNQLLAINSFPPVGTSVKVCAPCPATSLTLTPADVSCLRADDGSITASASGGDAPYSYSWSNGSTGETIQGLAAGSYTATVSDANGCTATASATVNQPSELSASITSLTDESGCGALDGAATVSASGGTGLISYEWSTGATGTSVTNLSAGSYFVVAEDENGCNDTARVNIARLDSVLISVVSTDVSVCGGADGSATASASNGVSPYSFAWSSGSTDSVANNLSVGTYTVTVTDSTGCQSTAIAFIGQPGNILVAVDSFKNVSCFDFTDGSISVSASGGNAPYNFAWSNGGSGETLQNLAAGSYTVTASDAGGCTATATQVIAQPTILLVSIDSVKDISCNGGNDGSVSISASGGTASYQFNWSNSATSASLSNLTAGDYIFTVTDAQGCILTDSVSLTEPPALFASSTPTNTSFAGGTDGSVNVTAGGGTPPYNYSWTTGATTQNLSGVAAGNYEVTVTDANGCTVVTGASVSDPAASFSISLTAASVRCNGESNGSVSSSLSGGAPPFSYSWSNGSSTQNLLGVAAGNYSVTVTDLDGITATASTTVSQPAVLSATTSVTDVSCNAGNDGSINVTPAGGNPPYNYLWSNGSTLATRSNLTAGNYSVVITDDKGCNTVVSANVSQPTTIVLAFISTDATTAAGSDGSIDLTVSGGVGPYTFLWSNADTTEDINNLTAGVYTVTVTDSNSCTKTGSAPVGDPSQMRIVAVAENVSCNGSSDGSVTLTVTGGVPPYGFSWSNSATTQNLSNVPAGSYTVLVSDAGSLTETTTVVVNEPAAVSLNITVINATCIPDGSAAVSVSGGTPPYSYNWSSGSAVEIAGNLSAGDYFVTVTDGEGCSILDTATVLASDPIVLASTVTPASVAGASDGAIVLSVTGGTAPYSYAWSNGASTKDLSGLTVGTYTVVVTDDNGCTATASATVNDGAAGCNLGVGEISGEPYPFESTTRYYSILFNPAYTYQWTIDNGQINFGQGSGLVNVTWGGNGPGFLEVIVSDGSCFDTVSLNIGVPVIDVLSDLNFIIYPNPNQGQFTLKFNGQTTVVERIEIINLLGRVVANVPVSPGVQDNLLHLYADLNGGIYFVQLVSDGQVFRKRFVVAE